MVCVLSLFPEIVVAFAVYSFLVPSCSCAVSPPFALASTGSGTELAVVSSKAALVSAGVDPALVDATFVGNVIQSRYFSPVR